MANTWNEGKKGLDEDHLRRQDQELSERSRQRVFQRRGRELLEKFRWRLAASEAEGHEEARVIRCPRCGASLHELAV